MTSAVLNCYRFANSAEAPRGFELRGLVTCMQRPNRNERKEGRRQGRKDGIKERMKPGRKGGGKASKVEGRVHRTEPIDV